MTDEPVSNEVPESVSADTRHEAHAHAHHRLLLGLGAIVLVIAGVIVWMRWGDEIKRACAGEEACTVELDDSMEGDVEFELPAGFESVN